jgi:hypothetical protein
MASNINSTSINEEFPVAGQDNDSQGFRDNFNTIKTSLATAATEITNLQDTTAKLDGGTTGSNIFYNFEDGTPVNIEQANLKEITEQIYVGGNLDNPVEADQNVSFTNGHYQRFTVGQDVILTLEDWPPTGRLAKMRVELLSTGDFDVTFSVVGGGLLKIDSSWTNPININSNTDPKVIEFWTTGNINGQLTVYGKYLGQFS